MKACAMFSPPVRGSIPFGLLLTLLYLEKINLRRLLLQKGNNYYFPLTMELQKQKSTQEEKEEG
jgi:hypothetical protein